VGLLLGLGFGYAARRWWVTAGLVLAGAIAVWIGVGAAEDPACEDDCPHVLVVLAGLANLAGWGVGLVAGTILGRRRSTS